MEGAERVIMIKREDIDDNILISLNKRDENWQIVEGIKNDLNSQKEDYANNVFKIKNEIVNGGFIDGFNGWSGNFSGLTIDATPYLISGKGVTFTSTSGTTYDRRIRQEIEVMAGHKVYYRASINVKNMDGVGGVIRHRMSDFGGYDNSIEVIRRLDTALIDEWENLSLVREVEEGSTGVRCELTVYSTAYMSMTAGNFITIDLTETFGDGNEPTKEEMDELIKILGGWFDGELTLSQKQIATWQLNLIRQNRNAIVSLGGTII